MGIEQDTIIYIEDKDRLDASVAANSFMQEEVKNRAYVNTLGAELAMKYMAAEGIDIGEVYNLHSIKKILEEIDISDVRLSNIHIDVRVVFDENVIFIPKSHFEYNLVPDIYLVFNLAQDLSHVKFLGFFEPQLINKNNTNNEYYFIEKEKLNAPVNLKEYIENFTGTTSEELSEDDMENSERIIMAFTDNDVSDVDKKYLLNQLSKSAELRDKFIEYQNFETLSFQAITNPEIRKPEINNENNDIESINSVADLETIEETSQEESKSEIEDELNDNSFDMDEFDTNDSQEEAQDSTENFEDDSFEDVNAETFNENFNNIEETTEEDKSEFISFDDINLPQENTDSSEEISEEEMSASDVEDNYAEQTSTENDFMDNTSFDDEFDTNDLLSQADSILNKNMTADNEKAEEDYSDNDVNNISIDDLINDIPDNEFSQEEYTEQNSFESDSNEGFGKSLLENLSENNNDIAVENIEEPESGLLSDEILSNAEYAFDNNVIENTEETLEENLSIPEDGNLDLLFNDSDSNSDEEPDKTEEYNEEIVNEEFMEEPEEEEYIEEHPEDYADGSFNFDKNMPKKSDMIVADTSFIDRNSVQSAGVNTGNNKNKIVAGTLIALLVGISATVMMMKPKNSDTADMEAIVPTETINTSQNEPIMPTEEILTNNTPEVPTQPKAEVKQTVQELKNDTLNNKKPVQSESYLTVSKLEWSIPDYLSYNPKMQNYLKAAGRSIKLSLSTDLLLATEYAYTNKVKVNLTMSNNGTVQSANIVSSSGSSQIDEIVLQSVKTTLNVVKPPVGEVQAPNFNLGLIIYF